eukprot:gene45352-58527_t
MAEPAKEEGEDLEVWEPQGGGEPEVSPLVDEMMGKGKGGGTGKGKGGGAGKGKGKQGDGGEQQLGAPPVLPPLIAGGCSFFQKRGWCKDGGKCRNLHVDQSGTVHDDCSTKNPLYKCPEGECVFFKQGGWCKHGGNCKFLHVDMSGATHNDCPTEPGSEHVQLVADVKARQHNAEFGVAWKDLCDQEGGGLRDPSGHGRVWPKCDVFVPPNEIVGLSVGQQ